MIQIINARILQLDPARVSGPVTITIEGSTVTTVTDQPTRTVPPPDQTLIIDAGGAYVMPGAACGHHHFYSWLARGMTAAIGPTPDFVSILKQVWWRLDRAHTEETLRATAEVAALETIRTGTTAVIDHHASPNCIDGSLSILAEAFRETGLRGILCYEATDRNGKAGLRAGVAENARFAREVAQDTAGPDRLVEAAVGAHAPFTLENDSLELLAETVCTTGKGLHIHVAEDRFDASHSRFAHGQELLRRLNRFKLLSPLAIIAHGIHLTAEDIDLLNEADLTLAHNCRSNMNNGVGYNPHLPQVNRVTLGTDGIGSDMWEELRFAFFKHHDAGGLLGPDTFVRFLNNTNHVLRRYFGRPFGCIEAGSTADLVITDYHAPTPLDPANVPGHLLYGMSSRDVHTVIVNGRVVLRDREFTIDLDHERVYARAREAAQKLWKRIDSIAP